MENQINSTKQTQYDNTTDRLGNDALYTALAVIAIFLGMIGGVVLVVAGLSTL